MTLTLWCSLIYCESDLNTIRRCIFPCNLKGLTKKELSSCTMPGNNTSVCKFQKCANRLHNQKEAVLSWSNDAWISYHSFLNKSENLSVHIIHVLFSWYVGFLSWPVATLNFWYLNVDNSVLLHWIANWIKFFLCMYTY